MIDNLDRVALWNIVCTVEAFLSAGFSPAELLASVHPARDVPQRHTVEVVDHVGRDAIDRRVEQPAELGDQGE